MKINNDLNVYDDEIVSSDHKSIYKIAVIIFIILLAVSIVLTVFFNHVYPSIIGYIVGGIASVILFYVTAKLINNSHYLDLKKITKRIHIIHQIVYIVSLSILLVVFRSPFAIIGGVLGFLLIKMSIFVSNLKKWFL